jgi:putative PIN family toxin of toxin-antitoxin system
MGKKEEGVKKVVLDTNVLVSALLFRGELSKLVGHWKAGEFIPVFSRETFDEFRNVLGYPKCSLSEQEIGAIIEKEVLPYFEVVQTGQVIKGVCGDSDDNKFIACALAALADYIVSGDGDLLKVGKYKAVRIINGAEFLKGLE